MLTSRWCLNMTGWIFIFRYFNLHNITHKNICIAWLYSDQGWSILPALELLPRDLSHCRQKG